MSAGVGRIPLALALCGALSLAACADSIGVLLGPEEAVRGASVGTELGYWLKISDREALATALAAALTSPDASAEQRWHNPRTGASGTLAVSPSFFTALEAMGGRDIEAPVTLDSSIPLLPDAGHYAVQSNSNVRQGPSRNAGLITMLPKGTQVTVLGVTERETGWALVARGAHVLGYVYLPLLAQETGGEPPLVLAGGDARLPILCRRFSSEVKLAEGRIDRWDGTACRERDGRWAVKTAMP
ncbi:MAG: SH3 domain-containing protein [Alphaproteobacteria bacterium]|nr:SH3 domain-containing protein [Alphaproteobacteria bacterium]